MVYLNPMGVSTAILIFTKTGMVGLVMCGSMIGRDGYSLDDKREKRG